MKYALVLVSDLKKKDWICTLVANSKTEILNISCYPPGVIKLPKSIYLGTIEPDTIRKDSCANGNTSEFKIVTLENLNLTGSFNMI